MKFVITPLVVLIFVLQVVCQSDNDPILVDEFDPRQCEHLTMKLDNFAAEVTADKETTGYIIVRKGDDAIENVQVLRSIRGHIRFRRISEERFLVFSASNSKYQHIVVELWMSKNKKSPQITEARFDLILPTESRRILFTETSGEIVKIDGKEEFMDAGCEVCCSRMIGSYLLADVLTENPLFDLEVIVGAYTMPRYRKFVELIRKDILSDNRISADRLRFYYGGADKDFVKDLAQVRISFVRRAGN